MAMYLAVVPEYVIMLIGRWSSDAFLVYLHPKVMQLTYYISSCTVEHYQHFYSIPMMDSVLANLAESHQTSHTRPLLPYHHPLVEA
jgi:hypothetical protein